jgi:hypothetical protein
MPSTNDPIDSLMVECDNHAGIASVILVVVPTRQSSNVVSRRVTCLGYYSQTFSSSLSTKHKKTPIVVVLLFPEKMKRNLLGNGSYL